MFESLRNSNLGENSQKVNDLNKILDFRSIFVKPSKIWNSKISNLKLRDSKNQKSKSKNKSCLNSPFNNQKLAMKIKPSQIIKWD